MPNNLMTRGAFWEIATRVLGHPVVNFGYFVLGIVIALVLQSQPVVAAALVLLAIVIMLITIYVIWRTPVRPSSHWKVLKSTRIWTIHDLHGASAELVKEVEAECLADGVTTWQEKFAAPPSGFEFDDLHSPNGSVVDSKPNPPLGIIVTIVLNQTYSKRDKITFTSTRQLTNAFASTDEFAGTVIIQEQAGPCRLEIRFPEGAVIEPEPYLKEIEANIWPRYTPLEKMPFLRNVNGDQVQTLSHTIVKPVLGNSYYIHWNWNYTPPP